MHTSDRPCLLWEIPLFELSVKDARREKHVAYLRLAGYAIVEGWGNLALSFRATLSTLSSRDQAPWLQRGPLIRNLKFVLYSFALHGLLVRLQTICVEKATLQTLELQAVDTLAVGVRRHRQHRL